MNTVATLVVYAYSSFVASWGPGPDIAQLFEKECACHIKYVDAGDGGSLLNRLKIEGKNSPADFIIGLDQAIILRAKKEMPQIRDYEAFDQGPYAFVYNTVEVKEPPKSLDDLLDLKWKGQIILEDPRLSTPGLGFLLWVIQEKGEEAAWTYLKNLKPQVKIVAPSWDMAYGLFKKNQGKLVFSYWTSPAYHIQEENRHNMKAAQFSKGNYPQTEYIASIGTQNGELKKKFSKFILSEKAQALLPLKNFMYPVTSKTPLTPAFKEIGSCKTLKPFSFKSEDLEKWLQEMARVVELLRQAFFFTLFQGVLSSFVACLIGLLGAPGFARLGSLRKYCRALLLFPNLLSPVLVVLGVLVSFKNFPFGLWGIVLGHVFMNGGLATVWIGEKWRDIETRYAPVNLVLGSSNWFFFKKIILPQCFPQVLGAFSVILVLCLSSFALPLVLGGGPNHSTLEVLIYEKLRAEGDLRGAVFISLIQLCLQTLVFMALLKPETLIGKNLRPHTILPRFSILTLGPLFTLCISLFPLFKIAEFGISHFIGVRYLMFQQGFREALAFSVASALGVASISFVGLAILLTSGWPTWFARVPTLSGVVVGLGLLLLGNSFHHTDSPLSFFFLLIIGHTAVIFFPVFRLCQSRLFSLRHSFSNVICQLGSSKSFAFKKIYFPLGFPILIGSASLAGLWSLGEFSVSRVLSGQWITFPIYIENLISSYRLEMAIGASVSFLALSLLSITLVEGLGHGVD